ncbi:hypothetical protein [Moraxella lacunata]
MIGRMFLWTRKANPQNLWQISNSLGVQQTTPHYQSLLILIASLFNLKNF